MDGNETTANAETFLAPLGDQGDSWLQTFDEAKPIVTLDDVEVVLATSREQDGERRDEVISDLDQWMVVADNGLPVLIDASRKRAIPLRWVAYGQVCERAKAKGGYLTTIPVRYSVPALNWGIRHRTEQKGATLRFAGDQARAVLSDRYTRFDDVTVLPALREGLEAAGLLDQMRVRAVGTGLKTVIRLSMPGDAIAVPDLDEEIEIALDLHNGEVGNSAVSLAPAAWLRQRQISPRRTAVRLPHLGSPEVLATRLRESIPSMLAQARQLRDQITKLVDKQIGDLIEEADRLRGLGLTVAEAREVVRVLAGGLGIDLPHDTAEWETPLGETEGRITAYEVAIAITALGEHKTISRRLDLEEAAARYVAKAAAK